VSYPFGIILKKWFYEESSFQKIGFIKKALSKKLVFIKKALFKK